MTDIASLVIKADTSQVKAATNDLNKLSQAGGKAQTSSQSLTSSFTSMRGALATLGISVTVGQIIRTMDSYTKLTAQLKLATSNQLEFNEAYKNVQRIASDSQTSIEETGVLYSRLSTSLKALNATQDQVSDITEAVALGLKISGASAAEAASSMLQLSQAFGAGALQGDEFRSINESAPRIMQALAESIGKPRGELKQMAADGLLTSDIIGNALLKSLSKFRKEAENVKNISGGMTGISNEFTLMVGEIDKATGASNLLAKALAGIAQAIKDLRQGNGGWLENTIKAMPVGGAIYQAYDAMIPDGRSPRHEQSGMIKKAGAGGLLTAPPKKDDDKTKTSRIKAENAAAMELANTYATLYQSVQRLNDADKTQTELLRDQLNAITNADKAAKDYLNTQLDQIEADIARKESIAENVQKQIEFNAAAEAVKDAIDPTREYNRELEKLKEFYKEGRLTAQEYGLAVTAAKERMTSFAKSTKDEFEELKDAINGFGKDATNALVDFAFGASTSFEQMANDFAKAITKMIIQKQLIDPLFSAISGSMSAGGGGLFGSIFGSIFGGSDVSPSGSYGGIAGMDEAKVGGGISDFIPGLFDGFRAAGGDVSGGKSYIVGEKGPELFMPKSSGSIVPNDKLGGKGIGNVVMNFTVSGATDMRSQQQIAAAAFGGINRAYRRNA